MIICQYSNMDGYYDYDYDDKESENLYKCRSVDYTPENFNDKHYHWEDFLRIAKGNITLAIGLINLCTWQCPETEIDQLERDGEITYVPECDTYILTKM